MPQMPGLKLILFILKNRFKGEEEISTGIKEFAMHTADPGSISGTGAVPSTARSDLCVLLDVAQTLNNMHIYTYK